MLDIQVDIQNGKVILNNLHAFADALPGAVRRGLTRAAKGIHREAYKWLSGPGAKASQIPSGEYPVPVRTGHLRRSLDWLKPGASKTSEGETFTAGDMEVVIYASAVYAKPIHEGTGSSAKFGPRPFLTDALDRFNRGDRIAATIEDEIEKEINKRMK